MSKIYHCDRYAKERAEFLRLSSQEEALDRQYHHLDYPEEHPSTIAYNDLCKYLGIEESQCHEIIRKERDIESVVKRFHDTGAPIFHIAKNLVEALHHTSVNDIEIGGLRFPYGTFYVDLDGFDFLPEISATHRIDGFYVNTDQIENELRRDIETAEFYMGCQDNRSQILNSIQPELKKTFEEAINNAPEALDNARRRLEEFIRDPYQFDYNKNQDYLGVYLYFTFTRREGALQPIGPRIIVEEPDLRVYLSVPRPSYTADDAVAYTKKHGVPADTYDEFVNHGDSVLNVTNRPELLDAATRLAFNILCYLNYPDRDEQERLSNEKIHAKHEKAASEKERKRVISKAANMGIRMVKFFGMRTFMEDPSRHGVSPGRHWRRGHWRKHACGKGLSDRKLLWIRPVVVAANADNVPGRKVYDVSQE